MTEEMKIKMYSFTLDCRDPQALGAFYAAMLGWETGGSPDGDWVWAYAPGTRQGTYPFLLFQRNEDYVPPVWPEAPQAQQQMAHLDFVVADLDAAAAHAVSCGARVADAQFDGAWRVLLDPEGHPFCLCPMADMFQDPDFALR